jgi:hypothetical protein
MLVYEVAAVKINQVGVFTDNFPTVFPAYNKHGGSSTMVGSMPVVLHPSAKFRKNNHGYLIHFFGSLKVGIKGMYGIAYLARLSIMPVKLPVVRVKPGKLCVVYLAVKPAFNEPTYPLNKGLFITPKGLFIR